MASEYAEKVGGACVEAAASADLSVTSVLFLAAVGAVGAGAPVQVRTSAAASPSCRVPGEAGGAEEAAAGGGRSHELRVDPSPRRHEGGDH